MHKWGLYILCIYIKCIYIKQYLIPCILNFKILKSKFYSSYKYNRSNKKFINETLILEKLTSSFWFVFPSCSTIISLSDQSSDERTIPMVKYVWQNWSNRKRKKITKFIRFEYIYRKTKSEPFSSKLFINQH